MLHPKLENLPSFVAVERDSLVAQIHEAFADVDREGGVSWSEAEILDAYGSPADCQTARASDQDRSWRDVLENPQWEPETGIGGWSFLDSIGFRYYLPAAMIRSIWQGYQAGIDYHLALPTGRLREHRLEQWSLLTPRQCTCVHRFLEYINVVGAILSAEQIAIAWDDADIS